MKSLVSIFMIILIGAFLACLAVSPFALAGFLFDYSLDIYFGKDIPWYGDVLAGTFTSPVTVPAAIVGYVLVQCDQPTPIFQ